MIMVEGLPLVPITPRIACPLYQLVIVSVENETTLARDGRDGVPEGLCRWVYGPDTVHAWPNGDYTIGDHYIEAAWRSYPGMIDEQYGYHYYLIDPDYQMDFGL